MRFFENSMWQSGRLEFEVPDPKTKESKASDIYVTLPYPDLIILMSQSDKILMISRVV